MVDPTDPALTTADKVLITVVALGQATAAAVSESAGLGYSTTTPKLRALEEAGLAERIRTEDRRTLWRATADGVTAARALVQASPEAAAANGTGAVAGNEPGDAHQADPDPSDKVDSQPPGPVEPAGSTGPDRPAPDTSEQEPEPDNAGTSEPEGAVQPANDAEPTLPMTADEAEATPAVTADGDPDRQHGDAEPDLGSAPVADPGEVPADTGDPQPTTGGAVDTTSDEPATDSAADPAGEPAQDGRRRSGKPRRPKGELRNAVLSLLQTNPDTSYKVSEICKLLDRATEGTGVNKASAGAVANALDKLVGDGTVTQIPGRPATYQAE
jgi:DNA-binding PadR family transcriptional regulator